MKDTKEPQKVYIGNGVTKTVTMDEKYIHYLDVNKLEKIINDNPGKEIVVGAKEDWFFTATDITADDVIKIKEGCKTILFSSSWDTFAVRIEGCEDKIDCTLNIEKYLADLAYSAGYNYGIKRIDMWFDKSLFYDCLRPWKYEIFKDFSKEVNALIKKYETIHQNVTTYSKHKEDTQC